MLASALCLTGQAALADDSSGLSVGLDYSTGKYGGSDKTTIWYLPVTGKYSVDALTLKLTVSYLQITGPSNVVATGAEAVQLGPQTGGRSTHSGLGDVIAVASYNVLDDRAHGLLVDVTGKIKFGTADDTEGLGTGKNDYAIQGDVTKSVTPSSSVFGTLGWKDLGDPPGVDFKNPWYATLGGAYKFTPETTGGLSYDYRQRVITGGGPINELMGFVTHKISTTTKLQGYLVKGFSTGSPEWGAGVVLNWGF